MKTRPTYLRTMMAGFTLVEVTLALGISAFCLSSIFGLLPIGMLTNRASIEQTAAAGIARAIACDLRGCEKAGSSSPLFNIRISPTGSTTTTLFLSEDGSLTSSQSIANPAENPRYRATVVATASNSHTNYFGTITASVTQGNATMVRILITWPALADPVAANKPSHYRGSYESFTALQSR